MNNSIIKKNKKRLKYLLFTAALLVVIIFGNFVERTPLYERAIVIGLALDRTDEGVIAYAQTVVNGNSTSPGAASAYDVVEGKGKTVSQALEAVKRNSGLLPSFAHCKLLVVGTRYLEEDMEKDALLFFEKMLLQDNTRLIAAEGKAKDILKAVIPILSTASEYVTKDLKLSSTEGGECLVTLKDYVQRVCENSSAKVLTVAKKVPANAPTSSEGGEQQGNFYLLDLDNLAASDENGVFHYYGNEIALARALVDAPKNQFITAKTVKGSVSANVLRRERKESFEAKKIQTSLVYYLQIKEKEGLENASEEELCALLKENILQSIKTCYLQTKENNVDVFSLKEILCKRYGYNPTDLDFKEIEWKVKVTVILR